MACRNPKTILQDPAEGVRLAVRRDLYRIVGIGHMFMRAVQYQVMRIRTNTILRSFDPDPDLRTCRRRCVYDIEVAQYLLARITEFKIILGQILPFLPDPRGPASMRNPRWVAERIIRSLSRQVGALNCFLAFPCACSIIAPGRKRLCRNFCNTHNPWQPVFAALLWPYLTRLILLQRLLYALAVFIATVGTKQQ